MAFRADDDTTGIGFLERYVSPVLAPYGFKRRGSKYVLHAPGLPVVVFEFRRKDTPYYGCFLLGWGIVPAAAWEYFTAGSPNRSPQTTWGILQRPAGPPADGLWGMPEGNAWIYPWDGGGPAGCAAALAGLLDRELIPFWLRMQDADALLAESTKRPKTAFEVNDGHHWWDPSRAWFEIAVHIDDGDPTVLTALLERVAAESLAVPDDINRVAWFTERLKNRIG